MLFHADRAGPPCRRFCGTQAGTPIKAAAIRPAPRATTDSLRQVNSAERGGELLAWQGGPGARTQIAIARSCATSACASVPMAWSSIGYIICSSFRLCGARMSSSALDART